MIFFMIFLKQKIWKDGNIIPILSLEQNIWKVGKIIPILKSGNFGQKD